jgi:mono/diheme cytochrome c family protein
VYIPALDIPFMFRHVPNYQYNPRTWNVGIDPSAGAPKADMDQMLDRKIARALAKGHLSAWDPVKQKEVWRVQHAGPWNGGVVSTAGNLVFQGTADGRLVAYTADTGQKLWEAPTQSGVIAAPVTYMVDGEQYVAVMAGWGGAFALVGGAGAEFAKYGPEGRLLAFKLGGGEKLPPYTPPTRLPEPPPLTANEDTINKGGTLYHQHCFVCHGTGAISASHVPDLRYMNAATHKSFPDIVLGGAYRDRGMVGFAGVLSQADADAIHAYLIKRGHGELAEKQAGGLWLTIKGFFYSIMAAAIKLLVSLTS